MNDRRQGTPPTDAQGVTQGPAYPSQAPSDGLRSSGLVVNEAVSGQFVRDGGTEPSDQLPHVAGDPMTDSPALRGWANPNHPMHRPPTGTQAAPYQPGNLAAVVYGGHSAQVVDAVAAHYLEQARAMLGDHVPSQVQPSEYQRAVIAWARAEARCDLVARYLDDVGLLDQDGNPRPAARFALEAERTAAKRREELGLTPLARAKLGRDVASASVDLARLWTQGDPPDGGG
jgi:hypothetical protein